MGEVRPERLEGARAEIPSTRDGAYRKLVYRGDSLAGALLYGDIAGAGGYYRNTGNCRRQRLPHIRE